MFSRLCSSVKTSADDSYRGTSCGAVTWSCGSFLNFKTVARLDLGGDWGGCLLNSKTDARLSLGGVWGGCLLNSRTDARLSLGGIWGGSPLISGSSA